ncbi:MAG: hypothetical protein IPP80_10415 [Ignavibacteria bacterium]|nr:hypothetical protein [Ignavibacteria bacterium]
MRTWFEADVYPSLKKRHQEQRCQPFFRRPRNIGPSIALRQSNSRDAMQGHDGTLRAPAKKGDRDEMHEKMEALREKHHDAMENIIDGVKPIIKRSKDKLRSIFDTNEDQIEAWRDKAREIMKSWSNEHQGMGRGGKKVTDHKEWVCHSWDKTATRSPQVRALGWHSCPYRRRNAWQRPAQWSARSEPATPLVRRR